MQDTKRIEANVVQRYRRWRDVDVDVRYKQRKAARIAQIIRDTGGIETMALELGVGPAAIALDLSRCGMKIIGMDISPEALERAKRYLVGTDGVSLLRGSGFMLPFRDGSFPLVYASQVLHLFEDSYRLELLRELRRVLMAGGRLVFDMKNWLSHPLRYFKASPSRRGKNFPSHRGTLDLLERAGFVSVATRAGVLPLITLRNVPQLALCENLAHTKFYIAHR